jgi:hypothetical protein
MIFLFPVKAATRCLFVFLLFFFSVLQAQEIDPDVALVQQASNEVLDKRVDVAWSGGSLPQLLKKLNAEHQVIFSYANNRIEHIQLPSFQFSATKLSQVLEKAFDKSGYNFILVGQIIAVVKVPASLLAEKSKDTVATEKQKTALAPTHFFYHIQPRQVSKEELQILNQIYGKEIKRIARMRKRNEAKSDTINKPKQKTKTQKTKTQESDLKPTDSQKFFVSAGLGLNVYNQGIRLKQDFNWLKEIDFKHETNYSVLPTLAVGVKIKHFLISIDTRYQTVQQTFNWTETIRKGPPDYPPPPVFEKNQKTETNKFTAVSIQFMLSYLLEGKKLFAGIGIGPSFQLISSDKKTNQFLKKTFEENQKKEKYEEQTSALLTGIQLKATSGYHLSPRFSVLAEIGYLPTIQTVYNSSIYSFGLNSMSVQGRVLFWL